MAHRSEWLQPLAVAALALGLLGGSAQADTVSAQSVWSQQNALSRAKGLLPAGAQVSGSQCQTVEVGLDNERYSCTLTFERPAPAAAPSGQTSGTTSQP